MESAGVCLAEVHVVARGAHRASAWIVLGLAAVGAFSLGAQTISVAGDLGSRCTPTDSAAPLVLSVPVVPAGDTVIVSVTRDLTPSSQLLQVEDTGGSPYSRDARALLQAGFVLEVFSAPVLKPLTSGSISIGYVPQAAGLLCARAIHVRGLARLSALQQAADESFVASQGAHATLATVTTTQARELVLGIVGVRSGSAAFLADPANTPLETTCEGTAPCIAMAYQTTSAAGDYRLRVAFGPGTQAAGALLAYRDAVVKGDQNDDGHADLVFQDPLTQRTRFWMMNGTSRVGNEVPFVQMAPGWRLVGADDFDADGKTDLVGHNATYGVVSLLLMNGTQIVADSPIRALTGMSAAWQVEATADFNHDGYPDLLLRNQETQGMQVKTLRLQGGLPQMSSTIIPSPPRAVDSNWKVVAARDYTGDGLPDLLWYNSTTGKIVCWAMDANIVRITGAFATPPNAGENNWQVVAGGDYGVGPGGVAGTNDIVWRNATSGRLVLWHMDGATVTRTGGVFMTPDAPDEPLAFTVVAPR